MALSDEDRRKRDRERKRRQRAESKNAPKLVALPKPPSDSADTDGLESGTSADTDLSKLTNYAAAVEVIGGLDVPVGSRALVALVLTLARDLDGFMNVPQRSSIATRYLEAMDRLRSEAAPVERDELNELRRSFYEGAVPDDADSDSKPKRRNA
ncbi:hypothetical protein [Leifsonia aquatica]|uniref:hypothetical protein n=1 Tax=Leifsonia aquatica TaxID=144185 RepID=UPI000468A0D5|nr:hypothetical protein [Leifsonia aquatica]